MPQYSEQRKAAVIQKMMPPHNTSNAALAKETGISDATLYNWRKQARLEGYAVPADGKNPEQWARQVDLVDQPHEHQIRPKPPTVGNTP